MTNSNAAELDGSLTEVPNPRRHPMISVERASEVAGISRSKAYAEVRIYLETGGKAGLPAVRFGRCIRVPTAKLLDLLGIEAVSK